ncbi:transposase [Tautonia sociabilis]|uniref:transposase n=1 Tax=Tautonia sociabilis TaxID=2080755 RepID=UPI00131517EE
MTLRPGWRGPSRPQDRGASGLGAVRPQPTRRWKCVTPDDQAPTHPARLILDRGSDSDPLRQRLAGRGTEMICPHRKNRRRLKTQDGRPLRRYKRRWKVERTFAGLGNFRRLVVRYEKDLTMDRAFFLVACLLITIRQ